MEQMGMWTVSRAWQRYRSFDHTVRLLLINQLTINLGFYLLMPYLAAHLSGDLRLSTGLVGLILGVRNLAQQGMFAFGGALADRFGFRTLIIAGCGLRTLGFAALGVATSVPMLIAASAATGLAGALFNPAMRAYLAQAAGTRRVEAFALFNVFYQTGIVAGPIAGVALTGVSFRLTCAVAAVVFAGLTMAQIRALPEPTASNVDAVEAAGAPTVPVLANRRFLAFAAAMLGSYILSFQVYLALPLQIGAVASSPRAATVLTGALFAISGLVTVAAQMRLTDWCRIHWPPGRSLTTGLTLMTTAFAPMALAQVTGDPMWMISAVVVAVVLLALGSAMAYPFEMDTIVALCGGRKVATHYGVYSSITGLGIVAGNTGVGVLLGAADSAMPWLALSGIGAAAACAVHLLHRTGRLHPAASPQPLPASG